MLCAKAKVTSSHLCTYLCVTYVGTYRINGREAYSLKLRRIDCAKRRHFVVANRANRAIKPSSHRDGRSGGEARIISQVWTLLLASCANKYRRKKTTDDEKNHMNTKMISHAVNYSYIIGMHWCENFIMQVNFCTYSHNFMPRISDN